MLSSVFILVLFIAAASDFLYLEVSNKIVFVLLILALMMIHFEQPFFLYKKTGFIFSSFLLLLIYLPGFIYKVFGAADVKILLIISLLAPFSLMLDILLYSFIAFMLYWCVAVRDTKVHAPFIPSLLVGMGIAVWLA